MNDRKEIKNGIILNVELESEIFGTDASVLNEVDWFVLTGGGITHREKNQRRSPSTKKWKSIIDLWTWIGKKSYQSITGIYSDLLRVPPLRQEEENSHDLTTLVFEMTTKLNEIKNNQKLFEKEIRDTLHNEINKMTVKIDELREQVIELQNQNKVSFVPPPPPPPPLPPPVRSNEIKTHTHSQSNLASPSINKAKLLITPEVIASVKLRKTKNNPIRQKHPLTEDKLVTEQMLRTTRAKLGQRSRTPVASISHKQLDELEKLLLEESTADTFKYSRRRKVNASFRSTEDLRTRRYRCSRSQRSISSPPCLMSNLYVPTRMIRVNHKENSLSCQRNSPADHDDKKTSTAR